MLSIINVLTILLLTEHTNLSRIHHTALSQHTYITDQDQYGVADYWTPNLVGDCEDYALWIQQELRDKLIVGDLWIVRTETDELHVVVVVSVNNKQYVIDNRHIKVMLKQDLPYKWLSPVEYYNRQNREHLSNRKQP